MVLHRQQAQFVRAKWRMALLLPCWALQMLLMLAMIGVFSYRLSNTIQKYDDDEKEGKTPVVELVWEVTGVAFPLLGVALTIFEVIKMIAETLTPWTMLFTHVLKIVTSCASLAIDIFVYIEHKERHYSLIALAVDAALILIILIPAIYAIRTYRRLASFDDYHHPANAKNFGYTDIEQQQQQQLKGSRLSIGGASLRRLSSSSVTNAAPAEHDPVTLGDLGRTPSYYNNERDTQFDKYMIDRAMSNEFSNGAHSPPNRSGSTATDASSAASLHAPTPGIVVSSGTMPSAKALRDSMGRTPSWGSSHVLVAVPEADEEVADGPGGHRQSADREALLGPRTRSVSGVSDASSGRFRDEARGSFEEYDLGERKRKWNP